MAERAVTIERLGDGVWRATWTGLLNGDTGEQVTMPTASEKCVHLTGTQGAGGTLKLKGTNKNVVDSVNDPILADPQGNGIFAAGTNLMEQVLENPLSVYPHVTAGDGTTNLECRILVKR